MIFEERPQFKPVRVRARVTARWLHLYAYLSLAVLVFDVWELSLLTGRGSDAGTIDAVGGWNLSLSAVQVAAYAIATVLFLAWFLRLYANLPSLGGPRPRFGKGWALGGWFVPVLNLVRPKQLANDAWRASDPVGGDDLEGRPVSPLLHWWWAMWLLGGLLAGASLTLGMGALTYSELETGLLVDALAQLVFISSSVLAVLVVNRLSERQEARAQQVHGEGPARPLAP